MSPAIRPLRSCSVPRVAEICCSDWTVKLSGRDPKDSWLASVLACAWVKPPVIWTRPSVMDVVTSGLNPEAIMVSPSSTMANWAFSESWDCALAWPPVADALSR